MSWFPKYSDTHTHRDIWTRKSFLHWPEVSVIWVLIKCCWYPPTAFLRPHSGHQLASGLTGKGKRGGGEGLTVAGLVASVDWFCLLINHLLACSFDIISVHTVSTNVCAHYTHIQTYINKCKYIYIWIYMNVNICCISALNENGSLGQVIPTR